MYNIFLNIYDKFKWMDQELQQFKQQKKELKNP